MNIHLADVTVHVDQPLEREQRARIDDALRAVDGVVSVHNPDQRPHLAVVGYNPQTTSGEAILNTVTSQGVHAQLIGL
jgi:hypothetical protein